jgi:hypothetical protein
MILSEKKIDSYECRVIDPNELLLTMPSMHYAIINDDDRAQFTDVVPAAVG